jgi:hypothetical protein
MGLLAILQQAAVSWMRTKANDRYRLATIDDSGTSAPTDDSEEDESSDDVDQQSFGECFLQQLVHSMLRPEPHSDVLESWQVK